MSLKLFPYKAGSISAKRLARSLGILRVRPTYNARRKDVIINWGNSHPPNFRWMEQDLNKPHAIVKACDKLETFRILQEDNDFKHCPKWTYDKNKAANWINEGEIIYCRSTTTGGWVYARSDVAIPDMLCTIAMEAVLLLGLDFGAVDIGHKVNENKFFVFEVNTAPGLEGSTLDKYSKAIYNYYRSL